MPSKKQFTRIQKTNAITFFCQQKGLFRPKYMNGHTAPNVTQDKKKKAMSMREIDDYMSQIGVTEDWVYEACREQGYKRYLKSVSIIEKQMAEDVKFKASILEEVRALTVKVDTVMAMLQESPLSSPLKRALPTGEVPENKALVSIYIAPRS